MIERSGVAQVAGKPVCLNPALPDAAMGPPERRAPLRLLVHYGIVVAIGTSLLIRVWHRGPYFPGWDVLGAAEGLRLVSTLAPTELWKFLLERRGDPSLWYMMYGVPTCLVPGTLSALFPWLYWAHATTLLLTIAAFALMAWAITPRGYRWLFPLACGASPAILSWTVTGLPYISAAWPYALAFAAVFRVQRLTLSLALAIGACELSWHVQELGRTVFLPLLLAAFFQYSARPVLRISWALVALLQAGLTILVWPTANTMRFAALPDAWSMLGALLPLASTFLLDGTGPDLPVLLPLALVAAAVMRSDRLIWWGLLVFQIALVVALAGAEGVTSVWPRRVLLLEVVAGAVISAAAIDRPMLRPWMVAVLVAGNVWQLALTVDWARQPLWNPTRGWAFPLPYTHTTLDYQVPRTTVDWTGQVLADIQAGYTVILLYNLSAYEENATNPAAVPERLYVALGHGVFSRSVAIFGSQTSRQHTLPVRPLEDVERFVERIDDPKKYVVHSLRHAADPPAAKAELDRIRAVFERRFQLQLCGGTSSTAGDRIETYRYVLSPISVS